MNTREDYEMVMVHHRPLQDPQPNRGMGNYLLYMTPGRCPSDTKDNPLTRIIHDGTDA